MVASCHERTPARGASDPADGYAPQAVEWGRCHKYAA